MPGNTGNPGGGLGDVLDDLSDVLNGRPPRNGPQAAPQLIPIPIPVEDEWGRPKVPPGYQPRGGNYGGGYGGYGGYQNYYGIESDTDGSIQKPVPLFTIRHSMRIK